MRGDINRACDLVSPLITRCPESQRQEIVEALVRDLVFEFGDVDPITLELFIGRILLSAGMASEGKEALQRAARWKKARERAEKEFELNFDDQAQLYKFLGANDFREYVEQNNPARADGAKLLLNENTVSYLFHAQQMEKALPLLRNFPGADWLTLGDGRMAFEARFLMRHGAKALPTNLDPTLLEECKKLGVIEDYKVENMESMTFPDRSFDFVCCKDSLHHCLQPYKALYEMLRVARKGIFLVEPFDHGFRASPIYGTRKTGFHHFEEEPGNYAYSFSERELEKLCVSHGWRCLATRGICNLEGHGIDGASVSPEDLARQRERVEDLEKLASEGKGAWVNMASILLRDLPSNDLRQSLEDAGYKVTYLPLNPHTRRAVLNSLDILYSREK